MESLVLSQTVPEGWRTQAEIFNELFFIFLAIGTAVGVVVVAYTLYHAYKGRDTGETPADFDPPTLGELPVGQTGAKSRKLFLSFGISAIIVISVVTYSYVLLLYVEEGPDAGIEGEEEMEIEVIGVQFGWEFVYPDGSTSFNELRVPEGEVIQLSVTSDDVWHNFGAPELRIKVDSIPGQYAHTWFVADEQGTYEAYCYELCGSGHSYMIADIIVMDNDEFYDWYEQDDEDDAEAETEENDDEEEADGDEADANGDGNETADSLGGVTPEVAG